MCPLWVWKHSHFLPLLWDHLGMNTQRQMIHNRCQEPSRGRQNHQSSLPIRLGDPQGPPELPNRTPDQKCQRLWSQCCRRWLCRCQRTRIELESKNQWAGHMRHKSLAGYTNHQGTGRGKNTLSLCTNRYMIQKYHVLIKIRFCWGSRTTGTKSWVSWCQCCKCGTRHKPEVLHFTKSGSDEVGTVHFILRAKVTYWWRFYHLLSKRHATHFIDSLTYVNNIWRVTVDGHTVRSVKFDVKEYVS